MNTTLKKYKQKSFIISVMLILFLVINVNVFPQEYILKQIKIEDGLSQSTIFNSLQDSKGYLWFATRSGLNRYDGYKFVVYFNDPKDSTSLSDDGTNSIFEDKDGTLWIGTIYGNINKLDRSTEKFYHKNISAMLDNVPEQSDDFYDYPLSFSRNQNTTITCIKEDKDGTLWIGTWGKGILRIDKYFKKINHFYFNNKKPNGLKTNRIMDLLFDAEGNLWVATFGGGLSRITKTTNNSKEVFSFETLLQGNNENLLSDNKFLKLLEDHENNLWIGSYYGGLKFIASNQKKLPVNEIKIQSNKCPLSNNSFNRNTVITLAEDKNNYLWIGTFGGGLIRYDKRNNTSIHFFNDPLNENSLGDDDVLSLCADRSGIIWAGSHLGSGITKIQTSNAKFNLLKHNPRNLNSLNDDVVWAVYKGIDNAIWIGTYKGGLNKYDPINKKFSFIKKSKNAKTISSNHIRSISDDKFGNLWIGTYDGGLNILNEKTNQLTIYKNSLKDPYSIGGNQVQKIFKESDSVYWIGTFGGGLSKVIVKDNPINQKLKFINYRFDKNNLQSISDNRVYTIFKSKDGVLWIGTYGGGLNSFDEKSGKFKRYPVNAGGDSKFNIENLMTIYEDSEQMIWLGSYGGSLTSFDRTTMKFKRYSFKEGLTSGVVYGILEDDKKNLWLSSDDGIFKLNIFTKEIKHFDIQDGVQSLEFSGGAYLKDKNGLLYFGGINGLNFFNPDSIKTNYFSPQVVITSIKIFNEHLKGDRKEIILDHKKNFITFEFSSLDYSDPQDNHYSYILEGLQTEWQLVDAGSRTANYTNLSPGTYIFKVRGSNSDGVWSNGYASIKIVILSPYWQTWWFIALVIILVAAFLYYLSTIRIKNLLAIEKLKSKLAADLHDNIGSGLTEISILSEVASRNILISKNYYGSELIKISELSRQLVDNMSDIVWVVNPNRDSLHDLIFRLKDLYSDLLNSVGISFKAKNVDKIKDVKLPMDFKQNLYLILKEAINNSIKHSNCKHIMLDANFRNDFIEISLTDDGEGFIENEIYYGNGLKNMQTRASQIGGKIKIKSLPDSGTSIRFIGKPKKTIKLKLPFVK